MLFGGGGIIKKIKWRGWILISIGALVVIFYSIMFYTMNWHVFDLPKDKPIPKFITHSFVDIDQIRQISKFRSAVGHDASFDGETCRSMRHYFGFIGMDAEKMEDKYAYKYDNYAPVSGRIMGISGGKSGNGTWQINIRPDGEAFGFEVRIDNIVPDKNIKSFQHVEAGQKLGQSLGMAEITIAYHYIFMDHGFSYFEVMTDKLFEQYKAASYGNVKTLDDMIITKEYRDAHPAQCDDTEGRFFIQSAITEDEYNNVYFHGYTVNKDDKGKPDENIMKTITDFESCAKLYPVLETYPEQCKTPDGRNFTKKY